MASIRIEDFNRGRSAGNYDIFGNMIPLARFVKHYLAYTECKIKMDYRISILENICVVYIE